MKTKPHDLAALGGPPLFAQPLHVGRPNIPNAERVLARIGGALERGWLTNDGPLVRELEQQLADYLGVPHCVAMANGTVALEVLARALDLAGQVIMPSFTFVATPHAFSWLNIKPVFCDVHAHTHTIDVADLADRITARTSAIVAVHLWGSACAVEELEAVAARHGLPLIYDAAHAFAASVNGRKVGSFGTAEVFSFHATKFFNTFEGGAVTTKDAALAARLRLLRNFGFAGYDDVIDMGTNAKMSEAHAAMGLALFESLDELLESNAATWSCYARALRALPVLKLLQPAEGHRSNHQYVVCEVDADAPLTRDQLLNVLWQENVRARRYFFPGCHRTAPYQQDKATLPVTEALADRVLVLPAGATITAHEVEAVVGLLHMALDQAGELKAKLPAHLPPGAFKA
ncbi:MAG TPA: aminotransferase class I/II-fold pyridoxal phosphate-dependent enzyme [Longimicrobiales bacterium]|nr:aminotransferase class I/II-fold pyridoxal phosphate-dependent enzyme [Longimicrobiales bacterium]